MHAVYLFSAPTEAAAPRLSCWMRSQQHMPPHRGLFMQQGCRKHTRRHDVPGMLCPSRHSMTPPGGSPRHKASILLQSSNQQQAPMGLPMKQEAEDGERVTRGATGHANKRTGMAACNVSSTWRCAVYTMLSTGGIQATNHQQTTP
jgi:hypothetical protein